MTVKSATIIKLGEGEKGRSTVDRRGKGEGKKGTMVIEGITIVYSNGLPMTKGVRHEIIRIKIGKPQKKVPPLMAGP